MKKIEFVLQTFLSLVGAFVFAVGVGSLLTGCLRIAGVPGWLALLSSPLALLFSLVACLFLRRFFMRFAGPVVNFWGDGLDLDVFTPRQFLLCITLLLSLPILVFFALVPYVWGAGLLGALLFANYAIRSKFLDAGWKEETTKL